MQPETKSTVDNFARVTHIIAGALAASVLLYMGIAALVAPSILALEDNVRLVQLLAIVFGGLSTGHLIGAHVFTRLSLVKVRLRAGAQERLAGYRTSMIVGFVLREGVALYGLMLSFLGGDPKWAVGFGAVALFSMAVGWPRRSVMEELAAEVQPIG